MAEKKGVGIWHHYRTNETPKADGLMFRGYVSGEQVEAKLYWAPADRSDPDGSGKLPYVIVKVFRGEFNSFTGYEQELRWDSYLDGEVAPRRNWKKLLSYGEGFGMDEREKFVDNAVWYHETMTSLGCTYMHHTYYYPEGKMQWVNEQMRKEWKKRKAA